MRPPRINTNDLLQDQQDLLQVVSVSAAAISSIKCLTQSNTPTHHQSILSASSERTIVNEGTLLHASTSQLGGDHDYDVLPPSSPASDCLPVVTDTGEQLDDGHHEWEDIADETLIGSDFALPSSPHKQRAIPVAIGGRSNKVLMYADSSDPGIIPTSPIKHHNRRKKTAKYAARTREERKLSRVAEAEADAAERQAYMDEVLTMFVEKGILFGDFLKYALDNANRGWLWDNIFKERGLIRKALDVLASSRNSPTGRREMMSWALDAVCRDIYEEGEQATKSGILRVKPAMITADFVRAFDCLDLFKQVAKICPSMVKVTRVFATTNRQTRVLSSTKDEKKQFVSTCNLLCYAV